MQSTTKLTFLALAAAFPWAAHAKINVVATTPDFGALAKEIGGNKVDVAVLAKPTEDPHFVDAKPSFILKLNRADVLIEGGAQLEMGWLPPLLDGARNSRIAPDAPGHLAASRGIELLEVPTTLDRSRGDLHALGNPHFMLDPGNARMVAERIAGVFAELDPKSADEFRGNLKAFRDRLDVKLAEWQGRMAPFRGMHVVTYHNSWIYFGQRFGLKMGLYLEPKPGIPPTPTHLAEVITRIKAEKVRAILVEPYQNRKTAETVARETGAVIVDVAQFPGGVKGTEGGYIPLMDYVINSLAKALSGANK